MEEKRQNQEEMWQIGQKIQITAGPFVGLTGVICRIDPKEQSARVEVNVFNRQNFVEVPISSLKRMEGE